MGANIVCIKCKYQDRSVKAAEKMMAFGLKALAHAVEHDLVTVYRWKRALEDGRGIRDEAKRQLIAATAGSEAPIVWGDFEAAA